MVNKQTNINRVIYTTWPKVSEQQLFVFIIQVSQHKITCFLERYDKYNIIAKFLKLHYYGSVKLIKYIMS